jgi:hypothetical protein
LQIADCRFFLAICNLQSAILNLLYPLSPSGAGLRLPLLLLVPSVEGGSGGGVSALGDEVVAAGALSSDRFGADTGAGGGGGGGE